MENLLRDFLLIFGLATGVLFLCYKLRLATTVGLLITGVLLGPNGFGLIGSSHEVEVLAEIGVVLLLFTIGIEFSLENLLRIKRYVILGGGLQVLITVLVSFFIARQFSESYGQSVFIGFLVSLSSTAIVLKIFQERAEIESPHGQMALAILIFQDIIVIPMMLLTPLLAGISGHDNGALTHLLLKGIFLILLVLAAAKWVVPHMLYLFARTRSRELFMLSILVMCFAVAFLTQSLGLSLALGAFLAGLIVSETEFSYEALGNIVPLRDVFTSLFFISVGMLLDLKFLAQHPGHVALISLGVVVLKSSLVIFVVLLLGYPIRSGVLTGLALCQVGEFSFILFLRGVEFGLLEGQFYHLFLNVSVITMGITPFAIAIAPRLVDLATRSPLPAKLKAGLSRDVGGGGFRRRQRFEDHLVIVGFGFNGRNVARVARAAGIPYVIVEMNPQTVRGERERGEPIYYGDAAQETVLERADIKEARIVVIVISDPVGSRKITAAARNANSKAFIIVRTRFITEMQHLYNLGADQVIPEEFETSIEIFSRVLAKYLIPRNEIERLISEVRADGYEMFRTLQKESTLVSDLKLQLPDVEVITFRVEERAPIVGKSLAQVQLRKRYGITLLALQRGHELMPNPDADTTIKAKDLLVLLSLPANLAQHCDLFLTPGSKTQCV